jgi:1-deoxy-D-xylulose-5-phosphate synthase
MAFMRTIPNMIVAAPMDECDLRNLLYTAQLDKISSPVSIRYPRGKANNTDWEKPFSEIGIGQGRKLRDGRDLAILTIGQPGNDVVKVLEKLRQEDVSAAHYDMRFVAPLDESILHEVFRNFRHVITVEDGFLKGGFGSAVIEFMADQGYNADVRRLGIPDYFVGHGTQEELYRECGFDREGIEIAIREVMVKQGKM